MRLATVPAIAKRQPCDITFRTRRRGRYGARVSRMKTANTSTIAEIGDPTVIDDYVEQSVGLPTKNRRLSKHRPHRVPRFPVFAPGLV